jgi:hypothetical protein
MRAEAASVSRRRRREEEEEEERGETDEEDLEEDDNGSRLSEGVVLGAGQPKVGSSHEVKLVSLNSAMKNNHNDGMVTVLEKEEEDDGKKTKKTKSGKMMIALRYTHERAPAADARKPVRVVRRKNNTTTNNNERGVVEIEFRNKEEEKSGIRYRGVTSTSGGGGGGGGRATTKTKKRKKKSDGKEEEEKETADDADEDEDEDDEDDEDDDNVECAILFDGKSIELRVLDETVAGLRVQRKREDEEESGIVSKRLDIGDAADVKNKRKKVNL